MNTCTLQVHSLQRVPAARVTSKVENERVTGSAFGALLRRHRLAAGLSQEDLAEQARMSARGIGALERGDRRYPYRETVVLLAKALGLSPAAAAEFEAAARRPREPRPRIEPEAATADDPGRITNLELEPVADRKRSFFAALPSPRNPYFTGREAFLEQVRDTLQACRRVALSGLGGLGKTQAALEYAYRYGGSYDEVFWIHAETDSTITSSFVAMAGLLEFPQHSTTEAQRVVAAVLGWLETHERWLLIADNADDPRLLRPFLPRVANGHLLITSRAQVLSMHGMTNPIHIQAMTSNEALRFLLARTGRDYAVASELAAARTLAQELGYLPLALEQAAAYIHENETRFANYVAGYRRRRLKLLARGIPADHPTKSVTTTWQIAFDKLAAEPAAADLLRASAFLSPDRIPLELIAEGAAKLGPAIAQALPNVEDELALDELLAPLARYSLIKREPESGSYSLHRLVQEVIRDGMDGRTRGVWSERVVAALNHAFPAVEYATWTQCERLLVHAQVAAQHAADHGLLSEEAARLSNQAANYLYERVRFTEAEPLFEQSLAIHERLFGPEHPSVAQSFNSLAELYCDQGRYAEAEPFFARSLTIRERVLGAEHPDVAKSLYDLAWMYTRQYRYAEAEPLYLRSLMIWERVYGPEHRDIAMALNDLAEQYRHQARCGEARPLFERSLTIAERVLGRDHPDVALVLNNFALLHSQQGEYAAAQPLHERALAIREQTLGPEHPYTARSLGNLAEVYCRQARYAEAEALSRRSLVIEELVRGPDHPYVALDLSGLAEICREQARYAEAESLFQRSITITEQVLGAEHPYAASSLNGLASVYGSQGRYDEAVPLFERSLAIREHAFGSEHPSVAVNLKSLGSAYAQQGRCAEAEPLLQRSLASEERALGPEHPSVAMTLNALGFVYRAQGRRAEAELLFRRSLAIYEKVMGSKHPDVAESLNGLADVFREQRRFAEAQALYRRSLTILESVFEAEHPKLVMTRKNLATLYDHIGCNAAM